MPLSGRSGEVRPFRLLGQYKGTLILLEGPDGLYVIDQHVAHERILFERLRHAMRESATPSQRLLSPLLLDLSTPERMRLEELAPRLEEHGFGVAPLSGNDLALTAVPAVLTAEEGEELLRALAASSDDGAATARARPTRWPARCSTPWPPASPARRRSRCTTRSPPPRWSR